MYSPKYWKDLKEPFTLWWKPGEPICVLPWWAKLFHFLPIVGFFSFFFLLLFNQSAWVSKWCIICFFVMLAELLATVFILYPIYYVTKNGLIKSLSDLFYFLKQKSLAVVSFAVQIFKKIAFGGLYLFLGLLLLGLIVFLIWLVYSGIQSLSIQTLLIIIVILLIILVFR